MEKAVSILKRRIGFSLRPNYGKYSKRPYNRERENARRRRQIQRGILQLRGGA